MTSNTPKSYKNRYPYLKRCIFAWLQAIQTGEIIWVDGSTQHFGQKSAGLSATVIVHNPVFYKQLIWGGSMGAAKSYIAGHWHCAHLTCLFQIIMQNQAVLCRLEKGWALFGHLFRTFQNCLSYSHISKSRKNIRYHYDVSNHFFAQILDKKMLYSCAIFGDDLQDLDLAQERKLARICARLRLRASDHLLEMGTGWGALAIYAAQTYHCRVTTTTISDAQYDYVKEKIRSLALQDRIHLLRQDYRKLRGQYDKLVSIEMIESIGYRHFRQYFAICNRLLKPGGLFLLQSITICDQHYERYKREVDFIKAYIFPGGCLPCIATICQAIKQKTRFVVREIQDIGKDYAKTLAHWHKRLQQNAQHIDSLGFDATFRRMFAFYFCYCQAGFLSSHISDVHMLMEKC